MAGLAFAFSVVFVSPMPSIAMGNPFMIYVQVRFDVFEEKDNASAEGHSNGEIWLPITKSLGLGLDALVTSHRLHTPVPTDSMVDGTRIKSVIYFDAPPSYSQRRIWR